MMGSESLSSADRTHLQGTVDDEAPAPLYLHESALSPGEFKCYLAYFKLLSRTLDAGDAAKTLRDCVVELDRLRGYLQCFFRSVSLDDILGYFGFLISEHDHLDFNKFLAFFRLLLHTANGEKISKTLLFVQPSAMDEFPALPHEMDERPFWLHQTALTQLEEEEYIEAFICLSISSTSFPTSNLESMTVSFSVAHGYFQARFRNVDGMDEVLRQFLSRSMKVLNLGQFLATMRVLVHKFNGEMVTRNMAFVQPSPESAAFTQHALMPDASGRIPVLQILNLGLGSKEGPAVPDGNMQQELDASHDMKSVAIPLSPSDKATIALDGLEIFEMSLDGELLYPKSNGRDDDFQQLGLAVISTPLLTNHHIASSETLQQNHDSDTGPEQEISGDFNLFPDDALELSNRQSSSSTLVEENMTSINDVVFEEYANPLVESVPSEISICDTRTRKRRRTESTAGHAPENSSPSKPSNSGAPKSPVKVILKVNKTKKGDAANNVECDEPLKQSGLSRLNSSPCKACALNDRQCRPHSKLAKACLECKKRKNKCSLASEVVSAGESIVVTRSPLPKKSKGTRKGTA